MLSSSIEKADAERAEQYEDVSEFIAKPLPATALQKIKSNAPEKRYLSRACDALIKRCRKSIHRLISRRSGLIIKSQLWMGKYE